MFADIIFYDYICIVIKLNNMKTYDIVFNDTENSNNKGFAISAEEAKAWIESNKDSGYFVDYRGGTVSIICNETGEEVYSEKI